MMSEHINNVKLNNSIKENQVYEYDDQYELIRSKIYDENDNIIELIIFNDNQMVEKQLIEYSQHIPKRTILTTLIKYYDNDNVKSNEMYRMTFEDNYQKYIKGNIILEQSYEKQNNYETKKYKS